MKWNRQQDTHHSFETPQRVLQDAWHKIPANDPLHVELLLFPIKLGLVRMKIAEEKSMLFARSEMMVGDMR